MCGLSMVGILKSPFLGGLNGSILIIPPVISDSLIHRIVDIWGSQQSLNGQRYTSECEGGRPVFFDDAKTNTSELIDVGMVDFSPE